MTASKRKKPVRAKPVLAWCIVDPTLRELWPEWCYSSRRAARFDKAGDPQMRRNCIARVEIREVAPKRRKRGAK